MNQLHSTTSRDEFCFQGLFSVRSLHAVKSLWMAPVFRLRCRVDLAVHFGATFNVQAQRPCRMRIMFKQSSNNTADKRRNRNVHHGEHGVHEEQRAQWSLRFLRVLSVLRGEIRPRNRSMLTFRITRPGVDVAERSEPIRPIPARVHPIVRTYLRVASRSSLSVSDRNREIPIL